MPDPSPTIGEGAPSRVPSRPPSIVYRRGGTEIQVVRGVDTRGRPAVRITDMRIGAGGYRGQRYSLPFLLAEVPALVAAIQRHASRYPARRPQGVSHLRRSRMTEVQITQRLDAAGAPRLHLTHVHLGTIDSEAEERHVLIFTPSQALELVAALRREAKPEAMQ